MQSALALGDCRFLLAGRATKGDRVGFRSPFVLMKLGHELAQILADTLQAALPASWIAVAEETAVRAEYPYTLNLGAEEYTVLDTLDPASPRADMPPVTSAPQVASGECAAVLAAPRATPINVRMVVARAYFSSCPPKRTRLTTAQAYYRLSASRRPAAPRGCNA